MLTLLLFLTATILTFYNLVDYNESLDVQLKDKTYMTGIPYDLIVLKPREGNSPGDTVFVRRQRPGYIRCEVIRELDNGRKVQVMPLWTKTDAKWREKWGEQIYDTTNEQIYPIVERSCVSLPSSYMVKHNLRVRIRHSRQAYILKNDDGSLRDNEQGMAQVMYLKIITKRIDEVVIANDPTQAKAEYLYYDKTEYNKYKRNPAYASKLVPLGLFEGDESKEMPGGYIEFRGTCRNESCMKIQMTTDDEMSEWVPHEYLIEGNNNETYQPKKQDILKDGTVIQYQDTEGKTVLDPYKYVYVTVTCPSAAVTRMTTAYDINMIDEYHEIVNNIPAAKAFVQPPGESYVEVGAAKCRIRSLTGTYISPGSVVEVQPRSRSCRLESLIMDENDIADLLVTKGFGRMDGLNALIHSVAGRSTMKRLSLRSVALGNRGAHVLARALCHRHNRFSSKHGGLTDLDISQCQIKDEGALSVAMMLVANWRLQRLRFEGNPSTPKALKAQVKDVQEKKPSKKNLDATRKIKLKKLLTQRLKENVREYSSTSKGSTIKGPGHEFFPIVFAEIYLGINLLPKHRIDLVNVTTGVQYYNELDYKLAQVEMQKGIVYYRKFRLNMMSVKNNLWKNRDFALAKDYVKYPDKRKLLKVVDRNEYNQLQTQQNQEIKTYIISGRLTNADQVKHSCKYFIASSSGNKLKIADMERACGLKDAFSFKDINTGETSIDKAKGGHEKWFKIVNKAFKAYEKKNDNGSLDGWVNILKLLDDEWKRSLKNGVGPLPVLGSDDLEEEDEEEKVDDTAKKVDDVSEKVDDATEKDVKEESNGGMSDNTEGVSSTSVNSNKTLGTGYQANMWQDPIAYYDALTSQTLNCQRRDVLGVQADDTTLFQFGAGIGIKYGLPFIIPSIATIEGLKPQSDAEMIEKKKTERFKFSRRVGACLAYILAKEEHILSMCFDHLKTTSDPPETQDDIEDLQLVNYFLNVYLGLGKTSEGKPEVLVEEIEKFGLDIFDLSKMVL